MWTHLKSNGGMGLEEQWILRVGNAPACSLKRGVAKLQRNRTLEQAQAEAETQLRAMGWSWGRPQSEKVQQT